MNERVKNLLKKIIKQFYEMVSVRRIYCQCDIQVEEIDLEAQKFLLSQTVGNELCQKFPPDIQYQQSFLKKLLNKLEEGGVEICDEWYEAYTDLLQLSGPGEEGLCYKTYMLDDNVKISLKESVNMISQGTTGLNTWQAAQHLAEWAIENKDVLENRHILELGSGLGLTGLAVCKQCSVASYTFTDCHREVLNLLHQNIKLNLNTSGTESESKPPLLSCEWCNKSGIKPCCSMGVGCTGSRCLSSERESVTTRHLENDTCCCETKHKTCPRIEQVHSQSSNDKTDSCQCIEIGQADRTSCDSRTKTAFECVVAEQSASVSTKSETITCSGGESSDLDKKVHKSDHHVMSCDSVKTNQSERKGGNCDLCSEPGLQRSEIEKVDANHQKSESSLYDMDYCQHSHQVQSETDLQVDIPHAETNVDGQTTERNNSLSCLCGNGLSSLASLSDKTEEMDIREPDDLDNCEDRDWQDMITCRLSDGPLVRLAYLDWENVDRALLESVTPFQVILAADVVYDTSIIPALVSVLSSLMKDSRKNKVAFIASTIRNEDTRDQFLLALGTAGLLYEPVTSPSLQLFHYDRSLPIEILRVWAAVSEMT